MINHFNSNIAVQYNINAAIFIQQLSQWTFLNLANKNNIHDGLCWSYNTLEAYGDIFPYWTRRQLETVINTVVKEGLIQKGNYNKHKYDRTCWYALTHKGLSFFPELTTEKHLMTLASSISPNCEMYDHSKTPQDNVDQHFTELCQAFHRNVRPIPTNNTTNNNISKDILYPAKDRSIKPKIKPQKSSFGIDDLKADNPHDIPEAMLTDWLEVRKGKKAKVTSTAWNSINKNLGIIYKQTRISPLDAFTKMVTAGWQSLELTYFINNNGNEKDSKNNFTSYI